MTHLDEIKSRLSIEELVGSYVQLKKAGRNLKGLCPFHSEKTPSFIVSPEKDIAYCFGCNKGGDIFKFTQLVENVEFPEAVQLLADKTNVKLPKTPMKQHNKRLRTIEANEAATDFFESQLSDEKKAYFLKRGLKDPTIRTFKLGYAPDSFDSLKNALKAKDFTEAELAEAGLVNQRSMADKSTYDRFRNRLIFPIFDHQGNAVGFGGRALSDDDQPKYLNSPDTPAYNKSTVLYGLNLAKDAIKEADMAIFAEGYMDVIASHQAGVKNIVAASGTALTPQQLKLIKRYTKNIALAFDQDSAGMEATLRAIELAEVAELNVHIVKIDEKDPDECIQKSPDAWRAAVEKPLTVMDFYFHYAANKFDKTTIEGKKGYMDTLLPVIKLHGSEVEKGIHLNRLSMEIQTDVKLLWDDLKKTTVKGPLPTKNDQQPVQQERSYSREAFLLGLFFTYPETYEYVHKNLLSDPQEQSATKPYYKACKNFYNENGQFEPESIKETLEPEQAEKLEILQLLIDEHYPDFPEDMAEKEVVKLVKEINRARLQKMQKDCQYKLKIAEDPEEKKILLNRYNEILKLTMKIK